MNSNDNLQPERRESGTFAVDIDTVIERNIGVADPPAAPRYTNQSALTQSAAKSAHEILNGSMHSIYDDIHAVARAEKFEDEGFIASVIPRTTQGPSGQIFYYVRNPKRFTRCLLFLVALTALIITLSITLPKKRHRSSAANVGAPPVMPPTTEVNPPVTLLTPSPVAKATDSPTPNPTVISTPYPVVIFSDSPTPNPTYQPTPYPFVLLSERPTRVPTPSPTVATPNPTASPTPAPVAPDDDECTYSDTERDVDPFLQCYCNDYTGFTQAWSQEVLDMEKSLSAAMPDVLPQVNDGLMADSCHPQNMALYWLALDVLKHESVSLADKDRVKQRYVLATLYGSMDGDDWNDFEGWLSGSSECQWSGVECNENSKVTVLDLDDNNMEGPFPTLLGFLTSLSDLDMSSNYIYGELPNEFFFLSNLVRCDLSSNSLEGTLPNQIVSFSELEYLSLKSNNFTGPIPSVYGAPMLTSMAHLDVSDNLLTGTIPSELCSLRGLTSLKLSGNDIGGTVPKEMDFLQSLEVLSLNSMSLEGSLPVTVGLVRRLVELRLDENNFVGTIPPIYGDLNNLTFIDLQGNLLQGTIPTQLGVLTKLQLISLSENQGIFGSIPQEMSSLTDLVSAHFSNMPLLTGTVPFCANPPQYLVMDCTPEVTCGCCSSNQMSECHEPTPKNERGNNLRL